MEDYLKNALELARQALAKADPDELSRISLSLKRQLQARQ